MATENEKHINDLSEEKPVNDLSEEKHVNDLPEEKPVNDLSEEKHVNDLPEEKPVNDLPENEKHINDLSEEKPVNDLPENEKHIKDLSEEKPVNDLPENEKHVNDLSEEKPVNDLPENEKHINDLSEEKPVNDLPENEKHIKDLSEEKPVNDLPENEKHVNDLSEEKPVNDLPENEKHVNDLSEEKPVNDLPENEKHINDLPTEILAKIFKFIDKYDIRSVELTCHQWLQVMQGLIEFQNKRLMKLTEKNIPIDVFSKSFRIFMKLEFTYVSISRGFNTEKIIEFLSIPNICTNIEILTLKNCSKLTGKILISMLRKMKKLKTLNFKRCAFETVHRSGVNKPIYKNLEMIRKRIPKTIKCLSFVESPHLFCIFKNLRNLESLEITSKYAGKLNVRLLYQIIKCNGKTLKKLHLTLREKKNFDSFLHSLNLVSGLQLEDFYLDYGKNWYSFTTFFRHQSFVTNLSLIDFNLTDSNISLFVKYLPNLESLQLSRNNNILTDKSLMTIAEIKKLKSLKLTCDYMSKFTDDGLLNGILENVNYRITELHLIDACFGEDVYIALSTNLPNLRFLFCENSQINDTGIQAIIKNCKSLIDLDLQQCSKITDFGLTGIKDGSENKIGHSISELKTLERLNLRLCNNITERTLIHGLKIKKLVTILLPACFPHVPSLPWIKFRKISLVGLQTFVEGCPNIERLHLKGCSGYENLDDGLEILFTKLKKLKVVDISRHCERHRGEQEALVLWKRRDLSFISIVCDCETCENILMLCENFLNHEDWF